MDTDQDQDTRIRSDHINDDVNQKFDKNATSQQLSKAEAGGQSDSRHSLSPAGVALTDQLDQYLRDKNRDISDREAGGAPKEAAFTNKFTGAKQPVKLVTRLKKRSAIISLVLALVGGASIPFIGTAGLPFAIIGNFNAKSVMHGAQAYINDHLGTKLFGFKGQTSVSFDGNQLAGITSSQADELRARGVVLNPAEGTPTKNGKLIYNSITLDGININSKEALSTALRENPGLLSKVLITKPTLWKTSKSAAAQSVKSALRLVLNPKLTGDTPEEKRQSAIGDVIDGDSAIIDSPLKVDDPDAENPDADKVNTELSNTEAKLQEEIAAGKKAVSEGVVAPNPTYLNNMAYEFATRDGEAAINTMAGSGSIGGTIWSFVNVMEPLDFVCSIYQTAQTANALARGVIMVQAMRAAIKFVAVVEKYKAGDAESMEEMDFYMTSLQKNDPVSQLGFGDTAIAQHYLTGKGLTSGEPPSISAVGGAGIKALSLGMLAIHQGVGTALGGSARTGRIALRDFCNIATNLGLQIGATAGVAIAGFFTGGAAIGGAVAAKGAMTALSSGLKRGGLIFVREMVEKFGKDMMQKLASISLKGAAKNSWTTVKSLYRNMGPWDKAGLALAGVATFGMPSIVEALSGTAMLAAFDSGPKLIETYITGKENFDWISAHAQGAAPASIATATAYVNDQYRSAQQGYIAMMQQEAQSTPFDTTNPYSAIGSVMGTFRSVFGAGSFNTASANLTLLASIPFKLPSLFGNAAGAAGESTNIQQMSDYVDDPTYREMGLAVQAGGSPYATFIKRYGFEQILDQLAAGPIPQITYEGSEDVKRGNIVDSEPKLSIVPGSALEKYKNFCHGQDRVIIDEQFWSGTDANNSPEALSSDCMDPGPSAKGDTTTTDKFNPLFADAIRFLSVVNPDAPTTATQTSTPGLPETGSTTSSNLAWPVDKKYFDAYPIDFIGSHVLYSGTFTSPYVKGIAVDISTPPTGAPIYSMTDGVVTRTNLCGQGDGMIITSNLPSGKTFSIAYGHGTNPQFNVGQSVKAGQKILSLGAIGCKVSGAHLHMDMAVGSAHICPQDVFIAMRDGKEPDYAALINKANPGCSRTGQ